MTDFFIQSGDEAKARNATFLDDLDIVDSVRHRGPYGAALVAVAQRQGVHVCWQCGEPFDGDVPKLRPTEVQANETWIMLHAGCADGRPRSFRSLSDITRGLQARKFAAKVVRTMSGLLGGSEKPVEGTTEK